MEQRNVGGLVILFFVLACVFLQNAVVAVEIAVVLAVLLFLGLLWRIRRR